MKQGSGLSDNIQVGDGAFLFGGEAMPSYNKINVLFPTPIRHVCAFLP